MKRMIIGVLAVVMMTAVSAQKTVDLTGTWLLQVETSQGGGSPTFTFKQTGDKLEGTYEGTFGKAQVTGEVHGNQAKWSFDVDAQGTALTIEYAGTVENDSMKGTVTLGEFAQGTFTGKKK